MAYVYQLNCYFGVFYDGDTIDTVNDILEAGKYRALATNREMKVGENTVFTSNNSDIDGESIVGFVAVEEMTVSGDEDSSPQDLTLDILPGELVKSETKNEAAVMYLTDLYEFLVKEFKKKKLNPSALYMGWRSVVCTWEDCDDESTTSSEKPKQAQPKQAQPKQAQPKQNPKGKK